MRQLRERLHNIDEEVARLVFPGGWKISMPAGMDNIYVDVPEGWLSLTVIETI